MMQPKKIALYAAAGFVGWFWWDTTEALGAWLLKFMPEAGAQHP